MSTSIGVLGTISDGLRNGLRERGHDVHDGTDDVVIVVAPQGELPEVPAESVVIALSDAAAPAYRAGAFFVAPTSSDAVLVGDLADRARSVFANRRAAAGSPATLASLEREAILSAMKAAAGSTARAAAILDISVRKVQYKLHEYGVPLTRRGAKDRKVSA